MTEHALDDVAPSIGGLVVGMRDLAGRIWRNDRFAAAVRQPVPQPSRIIGPVSQIMRLARRQAERNGASLRVGQGINLGPSRDICVTDALTGSGPSAARAFDGLRELSPLPPETERCALTDVLSAIFVPITPEEPDKT